MQTEISVMETEILVNTDINMADIFTKGRDKLKYHI